MSKALFTLILFICLTAKAQEQTLAPNGVLIHFYEDIEGKTASVGDIMSLHIKTYLGGDSLFFSSYDQKAPIDYTIEESGFKGDFMSGLHLLSQGDSACFWVPVDSILAHGTPSIGEKGSFLKYVVKVYALDDPVQFQIKRNEIIRLRFIEEMKILSEYFKNKKSKPTITNSGLHYIINKKGDGPKGEFRRKVKVHYSGKVLNGNHFDSSYKRGEPISFVTGLEMVIPGWEEALLLLNVGDKATIYIPSKLAYGIKGNGDAIPPNSILEFDMEFVEMY